MTARGLPRRLAATPASIASDAARPEVRLMGLFGVIVCSRLGAAGMVLMAGFVGTFNGGLGFIDMAADN